MGRRDHIRDRHYEARLFRNRAIIAGIFAFLLVSLLCGRLVYLQFWQHEHFSTLSKNNRMRLKALPSTRGLIMDRNGVVLAHNQPSYNLELVPEIVKDTDAMLQRLQAVVPLDESEIKRFKRALKRTRRYESVPIKTRLTDEEVAKFSVIRHRFPGVDINARLVRQYPFKELTAHVIGYVGRINAREMARIEQANYRGTSHIGKVGIEKYYEDLLHGTTGNARVEVNVAGRVVRELERKPPVPGQDLFLTLDIRLQEIAYDALGEEAGSVVAINPRNGDILAMVSKPSYDANLFVNGISFKDYKALNQDPERPLYNRAVSGQYPPGSTIKPFVGLASLETGALAIGERKFCPGFYQLPNIKHKYRDWKRTGHGSLDLHESVAQSCDIMYYEIANRLGIDRLSEYLLNFGFGQRTGVDIPGERPGLVPTREWKRTALAQPWYPGETLILGIGQGYMVSTPLQLAHAASVIASRGRAAVPRLRFGTRLGQGDTIFLNMPHYPPPVAKVRDSNWRYIIKSMEAVTSGRTGTARRAFAEASYSSAGKTGTSQVVAIAQDARYNAEELEKKLRDHALFIAFAPVESPVIAIAVLVENGGSGGSVAAPVARTVMDGFMQTMSPEVTPKPAFQRAQE